MVWNSSTPAKNLVSHHGDPLATNTPPSEMKARYSLVTEPHETILPTTPRYQKYKRFHIRQERVRFKTNLTKYSERVLTKKEKPESVETDGSDNGKKVVKKAKTQWEEETDKLNEQKAGVQRLITFWTKRLEDRSWQVLTFS